MFKHSNTINTSNTTVLDYRNMDNKVLVNQSLKLYKCNTFPKSILESEKIAEIVDKLAIFLLNKYQVSNNDLISKFNNTSEIKKILKVSHKQFDEGDNRIILMSIKPNTIVSSQLIVFLTNTATTIVDKPFNTMILIKSAVPKFLISCFESLTLEMPIIIKNLSISNASMKDILNKLSISSKTFGVDHIFGDMELLYNLPPMKHPDSLKYITINISETDYLKVPRDDNNELIVTINKYLRKKTKLNFDNLILAKFISKSFILSNDGKFKVFSEILSNDAENIDKILWCLIESLHSSL